MFKVKVWL